MDCNRRLELRLPDREKAVLHDYAKAQGVPVSTIVRRGIRAMTGMREPLNETQMLEVVALRKRISAIEARVNAALSGSVAADALADLSMARKDAQTALGR
ncbi:hypothetical protein [Paradevosia shaoguanensis]|uniref:hypothetical protein n=1 Tax=Paradevosia shaoguanensis TaxID=1335043 RepID=UPI001932B533|nr:hypothetical protein [Paradevosia shaoguanensis]